MCKFKINSLRNNLCNEIHKILLIDLHFMETLLVSLFIFRPNEKSEGE